MTVLANPWGICNLIGTLSASTLLKLDYTFDQAGNRLSEVRTPQPGGASGTHRDQVNTYDAFGRLTDSDLDNVTSGGTHTNYFANQWSLDALGNWLELDTTLTTNSTTETREHNHLNEITDSQIGSSPTVEPVYDEAGNLRYDGQFVYQYDAWNRLCQVNLPHATEDPGTPGLLVKHYLYDGLGRLIRVQSPYPDPETGETNDEVRSERIFYDGVRRIQELVTDPLPDTSFAAQEGNQEAQQALAGQSSANHNTASAGTENSLLGGGPGGGTGLPPGLSLEREYIWGPCDRGLDELIAQYGPTRNVSYPLHDGGGDIIALVDKGGAGGATRLLWQATYDAYGQIIDQEAPVAAHTFLHAGHKGLFFDRLDSSILDPVTFNEIPRLMPAGHAGSGGAGSARIIGYTRNRHLHTGFGRWLQRDPNGSGSPFVGSAAYHGARVQTPTLALDISSSYADGANIFEALQCNPLSNEDPLGLWVWGDEIDTLMVGMEVYGLAELVLDTYGFILDEGVDWALDWNRRDDEYDTLYSLAATLSSQVDPEVSEILETATPWSPYVMGANVPKMLAKGAKNARRASRLGTLVQSQFNKWLNTADKFGSKYSVYVRKTKRGPNKFDYTGITTDIPSRMTQHKRDLEEVALGLSRNKARCVEEAIMVNNPQFFRSGGNTNHSVSNRRAFYEMTVQWGTLHLKQKGKSLKYK